MSGRIPGQTYDTGVATMGGRGQEATAPYLHVRHTMHMVTEMTSTHADHYATAEEAIGERITRLRHHAHPLHPRRTDIDLHGSRRRENHPHLHRRARNMTDRDNIARIAHDAMFPDSHKEDMMTWPPSLFAAAGAILAAGYRKPRTITTVEELDALPYESVIKARDGKVWESLVDGWFETASRAPAASADIALPATVLHEPQP